MDGRWGYIDMTGTLVIPPQYQQASLFESGRALVQLEGDWVAIEVANRRRVILMI